MLQLHWDLRVDIFYSEVGKIIVLIDFDSYSYITV